TPEFPGFWRCYRASKQSCEMLRNGSLGSDVEAEVHDVTVLDDVVLAFQTPLARFLGTGFAVVLDEVVVADDLGADEALLEVGMDHARRLGGGSTDLDCPGTYFLDPGSEVGLQVEQFVTGADHPVQT